VNQPLKQNTKKIHTRGTGARTPKNQTKHENNRKTTTTQHTPNTIKTQTIQYTKTPAKQKQYKNYENSHMQ